MKASYNVNTVRNGHTLSHFCAAIARWGPRLPLANADNNQHGANENLRLQNLWDGIEIYAGLLTDVSW
jgi:acetylornithine deacetylase/succinyl-diaminopimelate desuccinylase-like protein